MRYQLSHPGLDHILKEKMKAHYLKQYFLFFQVDASVGTEMGTMTEPDCLGPLEPGTSVTLEGIVWHETDGGKPVQYCFSLVCYQELTKRE